MRSSHLVSALIAAVAMPLFIAPLAHAGPSSTAPTTSTAPSSTTPSEGFDPSMVKPGLPMPVPEGSFGYIATRGATKWMDDRRPGALIRNLPVPPAFRAANSSMGKIIDAELDAAMAKPGACVQIIVTPHSKSGLFSYGFFAIEPEYCPS